MIELSWFGHEQHPALGRGAMLSAELSFGRFL